MIIEIFGPPASGKTTFARNLAEQFTRQGRPVQLMLSLRPAELARPVDGAPTVPRPWAPVRRLVRPAFELMTCLGQRSLGSKRDGVASQLLALLPQSSVAWSLRLAQYITRLEHSWRLASQADTPVLIDQGFVQCLCSLMLLAPAAAPSAIAEAVALIPKADEWISIEAPRELLRARLEARRDSQSWVERLFELDVQTSLRSIEILSTLESHLRRYDTRITRIRPGEHDLAPKLRTDAPCGAKAETQWLEMRTQ